MLIEPCSRDMFDTIVEIAVGPEKVLFNIHKGLLCRNSSYFRSALEGEFKESSEGKVHLPEDDPEVFQRFQLWLYTGSVIESSGEGTKAIDWMVFFRLYVFGDARGVAGLQNATIDALIDKSHKEIALPSILGPNYIYDNTVEKSPLRRLMVDWVVYRAGDLSTWTGLNTEKHRMYLDFVCYS